MMESLEEDARVATQLLAGKSVRQVWRHRPREVGIEFTDGSRLFVDVTEDGLELSITDDQTVDDSDEMDESTSS